MKIEMGESLMLSWARHIKSCQVATLNWKSSELWDFHNNEEIQQIIASMKKEFSVDVFGKTKDVKQIISQAELDVLGINIDNHMVKNIFAIDVAFHENGLRYTDNLHKITEKMLRSALVLYSVFNAKTGNIIFASPKVQPKDVNMLAQRTEHIENFMKKLGFNFKFSLICNQDFYEQILLPVMQKSENVADTSELFMRCLQMVSLCKKFAPQTQPIISDNSGQTTVPYVDRQPGSTVDYDNNVVGFCLSCGHEALYPHLNQTEAFEAAARQLKIKVNTLKHLRDYFDHYNPYSLRAGWDMPLNDLRKSILDHYLTKSGGVYVKNAQGLADAYADARKILKLD